MEAPSKFMFIHSSNDGVNVEPDKIVRSFVMKSARNRKTWSTRLEGSKQEASLDTKPRRKPSIRNQSISSQGSALGTLLRRESHDTTMLDHSVASPNSINSDSVYSHDGSECPWDSLMSCSVSPCTEYETNEDGFGFSHSQQARPTCRSTLNKKDLSSFECLAISLDPKAERLFHQFIDAAVPRLFPVDPHQLSEKPAMGWIRVCVQSPIGAPFIYDILTSSARAAKLNTEVYKWRALSAVNRLLSDPRTSTNDTTISAVLIMLPNEEADLADSKRHSIAQAITTFEQPYAILVDSAGQVEDYAVTSLHSPSAFAHILRHFRELNIDRSLLKIIFAMTIFVTDLTEWYSSYTSLTDAVDLQKHANLLMYRLFTWHQCNENGAVPEKATTAALDQTICLALLIFMVHATEPNVGSFGPHLTTTVTRLRQSLREVPVFAWRKAPDLLFWVLTMGALGAKSLSKSDRAQKQAPDVSFFQEHIRLAFAGEYLDHNTSVDQLLERMRTCLWISSVFDERSRVLWTLMGLCGSPVVELEDHSGSDGEQVEVEYALGQSTNLRFFTAESGRIRRNSPV